LEPTLSALADQLRELEELLTPLTVVDWSRPTRCEGWDVADVVLHLAQTNELAIASAEHRFSGFVGSLPELPDAPVSIDGAADQRVAVERGVPPDELFARWRASASGLVAALGAIDPHERVTWVAGTLSARTLATTRIAETWIHTGDVAGALGIVLPDTERLREIARLAWRTLPYAFELAGVELHGPVAFDLRGPADQRWHFQPDEPALTTVRGLASELCAVAARRIAPDGTKLHGEGPDLREVLALIRTYA
jgi:uncharacterized protein (TIGR03084 family)